MIMYTIICEFFLKTNYNFIINSILCYNNNIFYIKTNKINILHFEFIIKRYNKSTKKLIGTKFL